MVEFKLPFKNLVPSMTTEEFRKINKDFDKASEGIFYEEDVIGYYANSLWHCFFCPKEYKTKLGCKKHTSKHVLKIIEGK